ncbi:hypothetical protein FHS96_004993 [Sphingomonas zeicaulis]|uniref:hypothetical protein n=1 Tax=Sphingomonas zeicaulis TaxID=1632740 RepID=UPI003D2473E1
MSPEIWSLAGQFGPLGLVIGYLVWRETRADEKRAMVDRERTESDRALAAALSALTVTIQHLEQGMRK